MTANEIKAIEAAKARAERNAEQDAFDAATKRFRTAGRKPATVARFDPDFAGQRDCDGARDGRGSWN